MHPALAPPVPDAPAQYAALVRFYADAEAAGAPDPASDALARLAVLCETALCARTAARLGVPWPAPPVSDALLAALAFTPAEAPARAALRYADAACALVACFEGLGNEALDNLRAALARRPARTLRALHTAWCLAWHGAHAGRVRAPVFAARLVTLGAAARACGNGIEGLVQSLRGAAPGTG